MHEPEHGPDAVSGPDDMAFADTPHRDRRSKRTSATPKKAEGSGIKGLFSSLKRTSRPETTELPERRKSRSHRDRGEDTKYPADPEEARRRRREERKRQQAKQDLEGDGMATDVVPGEFPPEADLDDPEARRAARRAQRASHQSHRKMSGDSEAREAEERRARRKEKERAREERELQLREEEEEKRREEKRARRAAREERRAREEQEAQEAQARAEAKAAERRERRRMKEEELAAPMSRHASKSRRHRSRAGDKSHHGGKEIRDEYVPPEEYNGPNAPRRSHYDYDPEQERRRAPHRSGDKEKEKGSKKRRPKSHPPPAPAPPAAVAPNGTPLMSGGRRDKISSWVHSQADDPPEPPPIVPTVLDVPPPAGEPLNTHSISSDEEARKDMRRKAKRRSRHPGPRDEDATDARARKRESRKSAAVHETRHEGSSGSGAEDHYPPQPVGFGKSWFKKFMG